jgi:hypothetical protein
MPSPKVLARKSPAPAVMKQRGHVASAGRAKKKPPNEKRIDARTAKRRTAGVADWSCEEPAMELFLLVSGFYLDRKSGQERTTSFVFCL